MFLVDALLILAMLFFLFLPITDRRTVRMRLCMICALFTVLSVSVSRTHVAPVLLASLSGSPGALQSPHILRKPSSGFSSWSASDIRLLHGQGNI
ncbi:hypothetical protein NLM31_04275 [Bradyrhizobium sp. CCGUVB4N]|uniref:hypothetical protein n=1 Tax=Bradyrhizobium sp. CCGUVB4N TaxID=2949631 RepID=UPI0020B36D14|nr:hypothetical protein [Bradyrhizobium sp. CCGUVB4N]MCP3379661.1 hypothetical protein [Bradyrhizobium sp. CCGUVB4N]